jgi:hypothetical protein
MFPPNSGSRNPRHGRSRTATNRLHSDVNLVDPETQTFPGVTGDYAQIDGHGSWHTTSRRVESHHEYGGAWAAGPHTMPIEATVSDDGYESSVVESNTNPGYNPHGYTNISPALVNSRHLGVDGLAPGSPSSLPLMTWTEDTRSDSWMDDSSQNNRSFGQETTPMDMSNVSYLDSIDGRDAIPPAQDVPMWDPSQQFQLSTGYDAPPLPVPVSSMPEFQGIPAISREFTSQPWSPPPQRRHPLPVILVSGPTCVGQHCPSPSGVSPFHTWTNATDTSTTSIGDPEQSLTFEASTSIAVYPGVNSPMPLSTNPGDGGNRDMGTMLQEVGAISYPSNDETVPRSV